MDITLKYRIIEQVIQSKDETLLNGIIHLLEEQSKQDFWDDLPSSTKIAIEEAEKEIEDGKGIPHEVVMKEVKAKIHP